MKRYEQVQLTVVSEPQPTGDGFAAEVEGPDGLSADTAVPAQTQLDATITGWVDTHTNSIWRSTTVDAEPVTDPGIWALYLSLPVFLLLLYFGVRSW